VPYCVERLGRFPALDATVRLVSGGQDTDSVVNGHVAANRRGGVILADAMLTRGRVYISCPN
jgi:hypothetical protein